MIAKIKQIEIEISQKKFTTSEASFRELFKYARKM